MQIWYAVLCISIHSLRMEGDCHTYQRRTRRKEFQSTPSAWRETRTDLHAHFPYQFQSTPSAWRETGVIKIRCKIVTISIHSLRMEGDVETLARAGKTSIFQSTPSAWRETIDHIQQRNLISYFNPLPPHGGRQLLRPSPLADGAFQSTPSAWRETAIFC